MPVTPELKTKVDNIVEAAIAAVETVRQSFSTCDVEGYRTKLFSMLTASHVNDVDADACRDSLADLAHRLGLSAKQVREDILAAQEFLDSRESLAVHESSAGEHRAKLTELEGSRLALTNQLIETDRAIAEVQAVLAQADQVRDAFDLLKASNPRMFDTDVAKVIGELHCHAN